MKIKAVQENQLLYAVIDDFYSAEELPLVMSEVAQVANIQIIGSFGVATGQNGESLRTGKSIWLDTLYKQNREQSKILTFSRKLFDEKLVSVLSNEHITFKHLKHCNKDYTILNVYKNGEEYKAHVDGSVLTALCFLRFGDFNGGELTFPEAGATVECVHNRVVIFPGCMTHQAQPIVAQENAYRVSIAHFLSYLI